MLIQPGRRLRQYLAEERIEAFFFNSIIKAGAD